LTKYIDRLFTLAEVYAALAYYHANTEEIETDLLHQALEAKHLEALYSNLAKNA
jgi:hypothetical protein